MTINAINGAAYDTAPPVDSGCCADLGDRNPWIKNAMQHL